MQEAILPDKDAVEELLKLFLKTRNNTLSIIENFQPEDFNLQASEFMSPTKWHLAHTTWFFEHFILIPNFAEYKVFDPSFVFLFNSYYNSVGDRVAREKRHLISRPNLSEVMQYREHVNTYIATVLNRLPESIFPLVELGIHHEMQHQELMVTDMKYNAFSHPIPFAVQAESEFLTFKKSQGKKKIDEGVYRVGNSDPTKFHFDNESPAHKTYIESFEISNSLVLAVDFIQFVESGAYQDSLLWHSDAWSHIKSKSIENPLYWKRGRSSWEQFTLAGWKEISENDPLVHVSYFEANAFAEWAGSRLPTEFEWESADVTSAGYLWEHTGSPYVPYPRFKKGKGDIGEYNGKFMNNQYVLRGGSLFSPEGHLRSTYRNFFYPTDAWQYNGIRLVTK